MRPSFLEFFAGIGLVHLGLQASGWQCVYANDIDPKKQEMYLAEIPEAAAYYHLEDIWNTDTVLQKINQPALLATASFPCIDLSLAGNKKGLKGEHSSTLFGFLKVMKRLKDNGTMPACVMLENVSGLLTGHQGKDFAKVCAAISELGFFVDAFVIDAKHFTPQSRPRLFIIGVLSNALPANALMQQQTQWRDQIANRINNNLCPPQLANAMKNMKLSTGWFAFDLPALPPEQKTVASVIDLDDRQEWWDEETVQNHVARFSPLHSQRIKQIISVNRQKTWVGTIYRRMRHGNMMAEVRFDGLAGCLRTPKGGSGKQIVIVIDKGKIKMRWMSPVEYARLQGAPNFKIHVPRNQALMGFADAVCVPAIEWIDRHALAPIAAHLGFDVSIQAASMAAPYQPSLLLRS